MVYKKGASMNQVRVGVAVFIWKDGTFLMGKRRGSHGHNTWSIPGGHLEFNETINECAAREVMEETGLKIANVRFVAMTEDMFENDNKHYITIWVACDWVEGEPTITEPDKYLDQQWRTFSTLPTPLFEPCWKNLKKVCPDLFA